MTEARTVKADPALGASYQFTLDKEGRRQIVFQMHVSVDTPRADIDALLDKIAGAADRQQAVYELREAYEALDGHKRALKGILEQRELLDSKAAEEYVQSNRKGEWGLDKLSAPQKQQRLAIEQQIAKWREGLDRWAADIDRLKPLVNGDASHVRSDRDGRVSDR